VPKIPPARRRARAATPESAPSGSGFCLPCHGDGRIVLADVQPDGALCAMHARESAPNSARPEGGTARPARPPEHRGPGRARPRTLRREQSRRAAKARARALLVGRIRAARRVDAPGRYEPHPGWRNFLPPGWRPITSQVQALDVLADLVEEEDWRCDKRAAWSLILRQLVLCMDYETGLVTAVTAARLGAAGDRATRTVTRVLAWAQDAGILHVVEQGASAEFLGSRRNRTPTYALITNAPRPPPDPDPPAGFPQVSFPQVSSTVDTTGDLPNTPVEIKPLAQRLEPPAQAPTPWLAYRIPESPAERAAAARCLLSRLGLDGGGVSGLVARRLHGLLLRWWTAGACVAGLLWAIDHHPDRPDRHRGDALRGARDPLAVLGARLAPWQGRLGELPLTKHGIHGDYRTAQAERLEHRIRAHPQP
jgi:hypothetical protein